MSVIALTEEMRKPLTKGDYVHFGQYWKPDTYANKYYQVRAHMIKIYDKPIILGAGDTYTFVFNDDSGLLPTTGDSLYEIFVGFKGDALVYLKYPSDKYFVRLEKTGYQPDPTDTTKRYIGFLTTKDSDYYNPSIIVYTTKDADEVALEIFNDSGDDQKIVIRFMVNHCKIDSATTPTSGARVKEILHWRDWSDILGL